MNGYNFIQLFYDKSYHIINEDATLSKLKGGQKNTKDCTTRNSILDANPNQIYLGTYSQIKN